MAEINAAAPLSPAGQTMLRHYRGQVLVRQVYSVIIVALLGAVLLMAMSYANAANSGKFFERLPYMFDFIKNFVPRDPMEIVRAMFDLPSPYFDGSQKYDYMAQRHYVLGDLYIPNFIFQLIITVNIAVVS